MSARPDVIAIEEHFMEPSLAQYLGKAASPPAFVSDRLYDFFDLRLKEMDAAGVDMQVLSHQSPGSQRLPDDVAVEACRSVNDALAAVIAERPDRFDGFAMLPTNLPEAAADEMSRAVSEKGVLAELARFRKVERRVNFGVNYVHRGPGRLAVGMPVSFVV